MFRRYGYYVAYGEGWALYCETAGRRAGPATTTPTTSFGQLAYEMWRAVRLVVDTGMHAKSWTRAAGASPTSSRTRRARSSTPPTRSTATSRRPAQALAYKIGQLKIRELRARAEQALGERFDLRDFHDVVLLDGSLPLDVLERRIDAWIAAQQRSK